MQILVNGKEIDFELQNNISVSKVIEHLNEWAAKEDLYVLDYTVDGQSPNNPEQTFSNQIKTIEVAIGSEAELVFSHLEEVISYVNRAGDFLARTIQEKKDLREDNLEELEDGLVWVVDSLQGLQRYFKGYSIQNDLLVLEEKTKDISHNLPEILNVFIYLRNALEMWKRSYLISNISREEAEQVADIFIQEMENRIPSLEEIAADLTAGNEKTALDRLEDLMQWLSDGIMVLNKAERKSESMDKLTEIIKEISECLTENDFVTLADILDYDLADILRTFQEV